MLVKKMTGELTMIETASTTDVKVCCVASLVSVAPLQPYLFRNYTLPLEAKARHTGEVRYAHSTSAWVS